MGQKVNPVGFRVGVNHAWGSRWFAPKKTFGALLVEDQKIREVIKKKLVEAGISKILIERYANRVRVTLFSASAALSPWQLRASGRPLAADMRALRVMA